MEVAEIRELAGEINRAEDMLTGAMVRLPDEYETPKRWLQSAVNTLIDVQIRLNGDCYWKEKEAQNG